METYAKTQKTFLDVSFHTCSGGLNQYHAINKAHLLSEVDVNAAHEGSAWH